MGTEAALETKYIHFITRNDETNPENSNAECRALSLEQFRVKLQRMEEMRNVYKLLVGKYEGMSYIT
jgi:hypothetical protein